MKNEDLDLEIELIPKTSWWKNARSEIDDWDDIRKKVYQEADYECEVCGGTGPEWPVEAHEKWAYEDGVQKLVEIKALCPTCHLSAHPGFANVKGKSKEAFDNFVEVNGIDEEEGKEILSNQWAVWKKRNQIEWELDLSYLDNFRD